MEKGLETYPCDSEGADKQVGACDHGPGDGIIVLEGPGDGS